MKPPPKSILIDAPNQYTRCIGVITKISQMEVRLMKQNRGLLIGLFVLLFIVFGGIFLFQAWNQFSGGSNPIAIEDESFSNIDVLSDNASIEIIPTTGSITTVEYGGKNEKNTKYNLKADVKGDTLTVKLKKKGWSFLSFGFSFSNMELLITVPEKQYELMTVKNNNGKIKAENMEAVDISFETDNGNIELKNIEADSTHVQSDNGRIILDQVTGKVIGKTDNGRITLVTDNLDRSIDLTTDNGRIEITSTSEPENVTIDAKTGNGKIDVLGVKNEHTVFGKGEHLIKLRSDNGRITVSK